MTFKVVECPVCNTTLCVEYDGRLDETVYCEGCAKDYRVVEHTETRTYILFTDVPVNTNFNKALEQMSKDVSESLNRLFKGGPK